jgi:hypothetical protein
LKYYKKAFWVQLLSSLKKKEQNIIEKNTGWLLTLVKVYTNGEKLCILLNNWIGHNKSLSENEEQKKAKTRGVLIERENSVQFSRDLSIA